MRCLPRPSPRKRRARRVAAVAAALLMLAAADAAAAELRLRLERDYADGGIGREGRAGGIGMPMEIRLAGSSGYASLRMPMATPTGGLSRAIDPTAPRLPFEQPGGAIGDVRLTFGQTLLGGDPDGAYLDIALRTRLPSATQAGFGSGVAEQMLRFDAGLPLAEGLMAEVSVGRRFAPIARDTGGRDYWSFSGSLALDVEPGWTVGLLLEAQDRQGFSQRPILDVGAFVEREVAPDLTAGVIAWRGMAGDGAFSIGIRLAYRVNLSLDRLGR